LAVTTAARFGAAGACRVTCCTGLGDCSGVWIFCVDCLFFRMSSIIESTLCLGGAGLGGGGLGGAGFFASGAGLGGSGGFSTFAVSGFLGVNALISFYCMAASVFGFSSGLVGGGGVGASTTSGGFGLGGDGGGSADF